MKIFLCGMMGSGKTTVARELAVLLELSWEDSDDAISAAKGMRIEEIFEKEGEEVFRQLERAWLESKIDMQEWVFSTGGGMPCWQENMALMNQMGVTVYLKTPFDILVDRLLPEAGSRPLLRPYKDKGSLGKLLKRLMRKRAPYYNRAQVVVSGKGHPTAIAGRIKSRLADIL